MKKFLSLVMAFAMLISAFSFSINAALNGVSQNPVFDINIMSPAVDAVIDGEEGWNSSASLDSYTAGYFYGEKESDVYAAMYFACDREGFYFAADIVDGLSLFAPDESDGIISGFMRSDGYDNVDGCYGFNGDVFGIMIDPLGAMLKGGFQSETYKPAQYLVGLFEDGGARMYSEALDPCDITDEVKVAAAEDEFGWCIEAFIPWDIIIKDVSTLTDAQITLTVDGIVGHGNYIRAAGIYVDRCRDVNSGEVSTLNKLVTVPEKMADGTPGHLGTGDDVKSLGIILRQNEKCGKYGHRWSEWILGFEPTYLEEGYEYSDCSECYAYRYRYVPVLDIQNKFVDVKEAHWYSTAVKYCVGEGYMHGMSETVFAPSAYLTREQFVLILANISGVDTRRYSYIPSDFDDVPTDRWYSGAVTWAVQQGYVKGVGKSRFGLGQPLKRGDMARLIYLYAESMMLFDTSARADLSEYVDYDSIPYWMTEGLQWAVAEDIMVSTKADSLVIEASSYVTRAQAASILMYFDEYVMRQLGLEDLV